MLCATLGRSFGSYELPMHHFRVHIGVRGIAAHTVPLLTTTLALEVSFFPLIAAQTGHLVNNGWWLYPPCLGGVTCFIQLLYKHTT